MIIIGPPQARQHPVGGGYGEAGQGEHVPADQGAVAGKWAIGWRAAGLRGSRKTDADEALGQPV